MTEKDYLIAISTFKEFGNKRIRLLKSYYGSYKRVWYANYKSLLKIGLREKTTNSFVNHRKIFSFNRYFNKLNQLGIMVISEGEAKYPANLLGIDNSPVILYVKGSLYEENSNAVAIVGTRKMTSYGKEVAYKFSSQLASMGITIISGLALGIDAVAHRACLDFEGRTLAVLASGLDIITPLTNLNLAKEIINKDGAIISEYPLGTMPYKTNFPLRNRIISGLSKAVIIIEGARKSGSLLTASSALEQGKTVFAVPGPITSPMSEAPNYLIQNGAKPLLGINDIVDELDLQFKVNIEEVNAVMPSNENERKIIKILENERLHLDEIVRITQLNIEEVSARLTVMELKGLIKNTGDGIYKRL